MTTTQLFELLARARDQTGHTDYVLIGSNAILALAGDAAVPLAMSISMDADLYTRDDPERVFDLVGTLGETSAFHRERGFFLDAVGPDLATLPEGWETRLLLLEQDGLRAWCLEPNDAAISKYARGEARDQRWIRAGLAAGLLSMPIIRRRARQTTFLDDDEQRRTLAQVEHDDEWLHAVRPSADGLLDPQRSLSPRPR